MAMHNGDNISSHEENDSVHEENPVVPEINADDMVEVNPDNSPETVIRETETPVISDRSDDSITKYLLRKASSRKIDNVGLMPGTNINIVKSRQGGRIDYQRCTVAFSLPGKGGYPWAITAGHCGEVGDKVYSLPDNRDWNKAKFLGTLRYVSEANYENGKGDWGAIRLYPDALRPPSPQGIPMVLFNTVIPEGTSVCKSGARTGYSCGLQGYKGVKAMLKDDDNSGITSNKVDEITKICVLPGDSGGPVFSESGIIGVMASTSATSYDGESNICTAPASAYYVPINDVIEQIKHAVPDIMFKKM